jgi:hypothetical protein
LFIPPLEERLRVRKERRFAQNRAANRLPRSAAATVR